MAKPAIAIKLWCLDNHVDTIFLLTCNIAPSIPMPNESMEPGNCDVIKKLPGQVYRIVPARHNHILVNIKTSKNNKRRGLISPAKNGSAR